MPDQLYIDPSVTTAQVVQVAGVCYQRAGPSSQPPDTHTVDAEFETCDACGSSSSSSSSEVPAPCDCPDGQPSTVYVTLPDDLDYSECIEQGCDPSDCIGRYPSPIVMYLDEFNACSWQPDGDPGGCDSGIVLVNDGHGNCYWELHVDGCSNDYSIILAYKYIGNDPTGTYVINPGEYGCATGGSITVTS